jgi:GTPase SAR1 family protein
METLNIAIIGATGIGKSTFVQRVLGLSRPPISNASSVRMAVDNVAYNLTLLELDLEYFDMSPSQPIQWPKQVNGHIVPRVDGALILYDVTCKDSILELPRTLGKFEDCLFSLLLLCCHLATLSPPFTTRVLTIPIPFFFKLP